MGLIVCPPLRRKTIESPSSSILAREVLPSGHPRTGGMRRALEASVTAVTDGPYSTTVDKLAQRLVITYLILGQR